MGLDMYLRNGNDEEVGYWRKANHIHRWFVDNIQDGEDDQELYPVSYAKLLELKELCERVLEKKDAEYSAENLPTQAGFFFGSLDYDDGYYADLVQTIEIIDSLDENEEYFYTCWW